MGAMTSENEQIETLPPEEQKKNREEMIQKIELATSAKSFSILIKNNGIILMACGGIILFFGWLMKETAIIFGSILIIMGALAYEKERKFLLELEKKYGV